MAKAKESAAEEIVDENESDIVEVTLRFIGKGPMLMTSDVGINPLDPRVIEHSELTHSKPKNTAWHEKVAKSSYMLALTWDPELGAYIPAKSCRASIIRGGTLHKLGTAAQRATILLDDKLRLEYKGPRDPEALYANKKFVDTRGGGRGVAIVRPKFEGWSLEFSLLCDVSMLTKEGLLNCAKSAGRYMGIGGYRTGGFGKFDVEVVK